MIPGAQHEVILVIDVLLFLPLVDRDGAVIIFLIPKSGHDEIRDPGLRRHALGSDLSLPKSIVVRMLNESLPGWQRAAHGVLVQVGQFLLLQIPIIRIR